MSHDCEIHTESTPREAQIWTCPICGRRWEFKRFEDRYGGSWLPRWSGCWFVVKEDLNASTTSPSSATGSSNSSPATRPPART